MKKILLLSIVLTLLSGCSLNKDNKENKDNIDNNENNTLSVNEQIESLIENAYLYSVFTLGNIETTSGYIEFDEEKYYIIENDKIKSIEDLTNLINNTFVETHYNFYYDKLFSDDNIIMLDNKLVTNKKNTCDIEKDFDFSDFEVEENNSNYIIFNFNEKSYYAFLEDKGYRLNDMIFNCLN